MPASRNRRILIFGVLAALFALGGGCLAYLATYSGGSAASSNAAGAEPSSTLASSDEPSPGNSGAPGEDSPGGGDDDTAPPKPAQSIEVNGVDLDGSSTVPGCITAVNGFADLPVRVRSVEVRSATAGVAGDPSGCSPPGGIGCQGAHLPQDGSCEVGIRLPDSGPSSPSEVTVTLSLTQYATCTDATRKPCNDPKVAALSPSAANPIQIHWTGRMTRQVALAGDHGGDSSGGDSSGGDSSGGDSSGGDPSGGEESTPDSGETPAGQDTPESPPAAVSS